MHGPTMFSFNESDGVIELKRNDQTVFIAFITDGPMPYESPDVHSFSSYGDTKVTMYNVGYSISSIANITHNFELVQLQVETTAQNMNNVGLVLSVDDNAKGQNLFSFQALHHPDMPPPPIGCKNFNERYCVPHSFLTSLGPVKPGSFMFKKMPPRTSSDRQDFIRMSMCFEIEDPLPIDAAQTLHHIVCGVEWVVRPKGVF